MRPSTLGKIPVGSKQEQTRMARPFDPPSASALTNPLRPSVPQRPTLKTELQSPFQNKYAALAEFPKLPPPMPSKLVDLKTNKQAL